MAESKQEKQQEQAPAKREYKGVELVDNKGRKWTTTSRVEETQLRAAGWRPANK